MRFIPFLFWGFIVLCCAGPTFAQQAREKRVYNTSRLSTVPPRTDGRLDDAAWNGEGWTGGFTQQIPRAGAAPSQPTAFKILFDDNYLYVAIRAYDSEPDRIERRGGRRDALNGDMVGVAFDSYHDLRTAYEFNLTSAGAKVDIQHSPPKVWDTTWDAVWDGTVGMEDSAWVAEMRIPLSQLRFADLEEQVWGLHVWRWINRYEEESQFNLIPPDAAFFVANFGELHGIRGLRPKRRIELLPYTTARLNTFEPISGNPFADGSRTFMGTGLDAKVGLSSAFTMDLTLNPDFGQVEADPSSINLTAFETFYEEKRPFFLEGSNLFAFEFEGENLFYSRRVGSRPHYSVDLADNEYARTPDATTILGAAKITGKTRNGLAIGILESLTSGEHASVRTPSGRDRVAVEPLTNLVVARAEQEYRGGRTVVGGIFTALHRRLNEGHLRFLPRQALSGGVNVAHYWKDRTYFVKAYLLGSDLRGTSEAITHVQQASVHYFQRPDADYLDYDSTRTSLSGTGGSFEIGRAGNGRWRFSEELSWQSAGLDFNEAGFMGTPSDRLNAETVIQYVVTDPNRLFRSYSINFDHSSEYNYGWDMNELFGRLRLNGQLHTYWRLAATVQRFQEALDMRMLRGGPSLRTPGAWNVAADVSTDDRGDVSFNLNAFRSRADDSAALLYRVAPGFTWRPTDTINLSARATYERNQNEQQYVSQAHFKGNNRYILGRIEQETVAFTLRASFSILPDLVLQFYGQPFISAGRYDQFKVVTDPRAREYGDRFVLVNRLSEAGAGYGAPEGIDETGDGVADYQVPRPDFNFHEFRSNVVLRWEYRPGSNLYVVWSQNRSSFRGNGHFRLRNDLDELFGLYPDNVFAIKLSYWFSPR